jgi:hypothetical protein
MCRCSLDAHSACSLELSAAYFQPANNVFFSYKLANNIFSRLFSAQANKLSVVALLRHSFIWICTVIYRVKYRKV